jgi:hypothetical protein
MRTHFPVTLALAFATASSAPFAAPEAPIPMRDFFRHPDRAYYRISGDGRTLSFMQPWERRMNIYVQRVGSGAEPVRVTAEKDRDIPDYFWKGADRIVYTKDFGGDENDHIVVVDRRGGEPKDVTPYPGVKAQIIDPLVELWLLLFMAPASPMAELPLMVTLVNVALIPTPFRYMPPPKLVAELFVIELLVMVRFPSEKIPAPQLAVFSVTHTRTNSKGAFITPPK